ncbi:hypothetical protein ACQP3F_33380, partial [Escherichia coli]
MTAGALKGASALLEAAQVQPLAGKRWLLCWCERGCVNYYLLGPRHNQECTRDGHGTALPLPALGEL